MDNFDGRTMESLTIQSQRILFGCDDLQAGCMHPDIPCWGGDVHREFLAAILDRKFPCTFAALGLSEGLYRFAFAPDPRAPHCAEELAAAISAYLDWLDTVPPGKEMYAVLIVFCEPAEDIDENSYRRIFEKLLREVNRRDPAPWPAHVPKHADDARFTFCFGGREIFVNANTPSHYHRRSRNLGPSLTLVLQPRDSFDKIGTRKVRETIRARVAAFDGMPASPEIGVFGDERNREYAGYFLSDDNDKAAARMASSRRCPFMAASGAAQGALRSLAYHTTACVRNLVHRISTFL
jgi:FPC/CPF motif-containing protein YcgG